MGGPATDRPFSLASHPPKTNITIVTLKRPADRVRWKYSFRSVELPPIVRRLFASQRAATLIEYSLIVALIAVTSVGAMTSVGGGIQNVMNIVYTAMN
jgi:Flp pilus assembly pilin Flp